MTVYIYGKSHVQICMKEEGNFLMDSKTYLAIGAFINNHHERDRHLLSSPLVRVIRFLIPSIICLVKISAAHFIKSDCALAGNSQTGTVDLKLGLLLDILLFFHAVGIHRYIHTSL